MRTSEKATGRPASRLIDQRIRDLGGWRGETLARMRTLILEADPEMTEEWKWMGTQGNTRRAIDIHEGEKVDAGAFKALVKAAVAQNGPPVMARADLGSVDEYIGTHPEEVQAILRRVRSTLRKALPGAEEVISYQIPCYKAHGGYVVYFAGWKQHYSLYPATGPLVAAFKTDLAPYEVGKGTIRFPISQPVPVKLIERIAKFLAKEAAERTKAKRAGSKKRR